MNKNIAVRFRILAVAALLMAASPTWAATVGYWRFENAGSLGLDSSGNGLDLTASGSPASENITDVGPGQNFFKQVPLTGQTNALGVRLSGLNNISFARPYAAAFGVTTQFTAEAFINLSTIAANYTTPVVTRWNQTSASGSNAVSFVFGVRMDGNSIIRPRLTMAPANADPNGSVTYLCTALSLVTNRDYYLAAVFNTGTVTFYLADLSTAVPQLQLETATGFPHAAVNTPATFRVGAHQLSTGLNLFPGLIDEVRFSDRALADNELLVAGGVAIPPHITSNPQDQTNQLGSSTSLSVSAAGSLPLSYQWFHAGAAIPGGTATTLNLTNVQLRDAGDYYAVATNAFGVTASAPATLLTTPSYRITDPPALFPDGSFRVGYEGMTGGGYTIEQSEYVTGPWNFFTNLTAGTNGLFELVDAAQPRAQTRFFRAALDVSVTPDAYQKRWRDPAVNARIQSNIEQYRKGDATIEVVDSSGNPVAGVAVQLQQVTHEFLFGCDGFVLGQLGSTNELYEQTFAHLFNFCTVPFYWGDIEPVQGQPRYADDGSQPDIWRRPPPDRFIPFAAKYGITLKGHPLVWHYINPTWLPTDPATVRALYTNRFAQIAGRYTNTIPIWDGVNESLSTTTAYPLYTPDLAYVAWVFDQEATIFPPQCALLINELTGHNFGSAADQYFNQVTNLLTRGKRIQGVGFQFHFFDRASLDGYVSGSTCDPTTLLNKYDKFGQLGLPLYITEITIGSAGTNGESLQAEVVRDHYRLWFGTPAMAGITWWNLGDGLATPNENAGNGGLVDRAIAPKAAYRALDQLINHEWKTSLQTQTDPQGQVGFRGFFGKYQVTVFTGGTNRQFEVNHQRSGPASHLIVLPD